MPSASLLYFDPNLLWTLTFNHITSYIYHIFNHVLSFYDFLSQTKDTQFRSCRPVFRSFISINNISGGSINNSSMPSLKCQACLIKHLTIIDIFLTLCLQNLDATHFGKSCLIQHRFFIFLIFYIVRDIVRCNLYCLIDYLGLFKRLM